MLGYPFSEPVFFFSVRVVMSILNLIMSRICFSMYFARSWTLRGNGMVGWFAGTIRYVTLSVLYFSRRYICFMIFSQRSVLVSSVLASILSSLAMTSRYSLFLLVAQTAPLSDGMPVPRFFSR